MIGKILKWGNSYGIRLTKADIERQGLKPGQDVVFEISNRRDRPAPMDDYPVAKFGGRLSLDHDPEDWH